MTYKVVPFVASIDQDKGTTRDIADQLEELITQWADLGWTYVRLESVATWVKPTDGCFGVGAKSGYTTSKQMVVFMS